MTRAYDRTNLFSQCLTARVHGSNRTVESSLPLPGLCSERAASRARGAPAAQCSFWHALLQYSTLLHAVKMIVKMMSLRTSRLSRSSLASSARHAPGRRVRARAARSSVCRAGVCDESSQVGPKDDLGALKSSLSEVHAPRVITVPLARLLRVEQHVRTSQAKCRTYRVLRVLKNDRIHPTKRHTRPMARAVLGAASSRRKQCKSTKPRLVLESKGVW
jgi:hypothetical protein